MAKSKKVVDLKKLAANDKETPKEKPEERYVIGNIATVRSGFYFELVAFVQKKQNSHGVAAETIAKEFVGRQINGRGINAARVARYLRYGINHGTLKLKNGGTK